MAKRKTVGEIALKARSDSTKYDSLEIGHALSNDILDQLWTCIDNHKNIINEPEFCVVMVLADDPLIKGVMRRKFYAWPYLPKPRPRQSCFLYRRKKDDILRLWVLPEAFCMAALSEIYSVSPEWRTMKGWSDAFYAGKFWEYIRKQHDIDLLSESEYLDANREKLIQAGCKETKSRVAEAFDFSKVAVNQVVDSKDALTR